MTVQELVELMNANRWEEADVLKINEALIRIFDYAENFYDNVENDIGQCSPSALLRPIEGLSEGRISGSS
jgi:hypothetical protein